MQAVGFIVEYNPFHNGHEWHLKEARRLSGCDYTVGVMSGNFVQRGEPAFIDKWKRAEMAVCAGVDLIIELPVVFAVRSAQYFAAGGVRLLNSLGIVSHICFGAEHADLKTLEKAADAINSTQIKISIRNGLKTGATYAAVLSKVLQAECGLSADILSAPNNILAIEYIRAIQKYAPELVPLPVSRKHAQYHETTITSNIASATAIRQAILSNGHVNCEIGAALPPSAGRIINELIVNRRCPVTFSSLSDIILARLRTLRLNDIEQLPDVSEGLHHKIKSAALLAANTEDLFGLIKSKRYTRTRLQRIIIHSILGTTKSEVGAYDQTGPLYARVLAFNKRGRIMLNEIEKQSELPIITKTTQFLNSKQRELETLNPLQKMLAVDTLASDIYVLGLPSPASKSGGWDFRQSPLYVPVNC